jgi:predicted RNase H-like nuclease
MPAVLGIDAAWTDRQPSGVALAAKRGGRWRILAVSSSYEEFGSTRQSARPKGGDPDIEKLLQTASELAGASVELVAVDMPLSHETITGRRVSDQAVSLVFGGRWAATHTPNPERPGKVGRLLGDGFKAAGYPLATETISVPCLIEVYPHPALVELANAEHRLPYKIGKARDYWPSQTPAERRATIIEVWSQIVTLLGHELDGIDEALPLPPANSALATLKAYEDALDSVICAWVGITALEGRARPYGDAVSAIWVPTNRAASTTLYQTDGERS